MAYKILSLDGGGSWAMIQARVLKDIYGDINGHALLKQFDMVISNSGGSLVLACLCNDMKLSETISVFEDEQSRKQVFSRLSFLEELNPHDSMALLRKLFDIGPKYNTERKLKGIIEVLTEKDHLFKEGKLNQPIIQTPMNELPGIIGKPELQIVIAGFDYVHERVTFFRSNMLSNTDRFTPKYFAMPLGHAIHASSNAPVNYFDAAAATNPFIRKPKPDFKDKTYSMTSWYWDGAVSGFNNPVLAGLIEAMTNGIPSNDCCILSLGTGTGSKVLLSDKITSTDPDDQLVCEANKNNPLVDVSSSFAFFKDIKKMATSILDDPPDSATFIAYSIMDPSLTDKANLIRINPCYSPVINNETKLYEVPVIFKNDPDAVNKLLKLIDLDMDAVENSEVNLIIDLCDKFVTDNINGLPNQLIRGDKSADCLGQLTYAEAKGKWKNCV
jgi:uncharacterized protein